MTAETASSAPVARPTPVLGTWDMTLLTVGSVIGSGIFLVPGQVAGAVGGSLFLSSAIWLAGAVLCLCGALSYARIARCRPEAGGLYIYIRDGFGPAAGTVFGWMALVVNTSGTVAALASAIAVMFHNALPLALPVPLIAAVVAAAIGWINLLPTRSNGRFQGATAIARSSVVIIIGLVLIARFYTERPVVIPFASTRHGETLALLAVLWAFDGWQMVTAVSGEARNPMRSVSRGLTFGVAILAGTFLLINTAAVLWLDPADMQAGTNVIAVALRRAGLPAVAQSIDLFLPIALLGVAHATLLTGSRVAYAMARDGVLPATFARLQPRTSVPTAAVLACTITAIVLSVIGNFDDPLAYVIAPSWLFYGLAALALVRVPDIRERVATRGARIAAVGFFVGALAVPATALIGGPPSARLGLLLVALTWITVVLWQRRRDH